MSPEEIVAAGLAIADAEGLEALSMRRVPQELGVGTMTLYSHVAGKEELLELMNDEVMGEVVVPGELPADWREALCALARRTVGALVRHAWVAGDRGRAPVLGPNSLLHVEQSIAAVEPLGLDPGTAGAVLACVDDYAIGYALRTIATRRWRDEAGIEVPMGDLAAQPRRACAGCWTPAGTRGCGAPSRRAPSRRPTSASRRACAGCSTASRPRWRARGRRRDTIEARRQRGELR